MSEPHKEALLSQFRDDLLAIDRSVLRLVRLRREKVREIQNLKRDMGRPSVEPARELLVLQELRRFEMTQHSAPLSDHTVGCVYDSMVDLVRGELEQGR